MMFSKIGALAILTLCLVGQSVQEECAPQGVINLNVILSYFLFWRPALGETCTIDEYLVYIFHPEQPAEYAFSVNDTRVNIAFLEACEEWTFVVVPVSGHTTGPQRRVVDKLPLSLYADLSLTDLILNHNPYTDRTHIHWDLNDKKWGNCSLQYRVTVEEFGSPVIEDFYVKTNSLDLHFLSNCATYQFGVRAINTAEPTIIEGPLKTSISYIPGRRQYPPVLQAVQSYPTSINLTFRLESELRNPCALMFLYVEGEIPSIRIDLSEHDRSQPVNVMITDLQPATYYNTYAYVDNIAGRSEATIMILETDSNSTPYTTVEE